MAKQKRIRIDNWLGRVSNADAHALPPGAHQLQDNLQCLIEGQLTVREGIQKQTGFIPSSPGSGDVLSIFALSRGDGAYVITQDNAGVVAARRASVNTTLASSRPTFVAMSHARTPRGYWIGVDGLSRGLIWNGSSSAAWALGITAPTSAPTISTPAGGAATAGDYGCAYRFGDIDQPDRNWSSLSASTTATAVANDKFTHTALSSSSETRITGVTTRRGVVQIWRTTSGGTNVYYFIVELVHNGTITSTENSGGFQQHTVPTGHGIVVGQRITISGASHASVNATQEVSAIAATTVTTTTAYSADSTGGTWVNEGYVADTASDATLIAAAVADETKRLVVLDTNGDLGARRFTPPPTTKQHVVFHKDRAFYLGDVAYNEGTVATGGNTTLTGSGTAWTSDMVGRYVYIDGEVIPHVVSAVGGATSITLATAAATSASGKSYVIRPAPDERGCIYFSELDEPESVPTTNIIRVQTDPTDDDEIVGGFSLGSVLYIVSERHIYSLTYGVNPLRDGAIDLLQHGRGALNKRCMDIFEGQAYLMDALGVYSMSPGGDIQVGVGVEVQDLFRDATLDLAKSKWFFTQADPRTRIVRHWVTNTGDSSTRPTRAIAYSASTGRWWTESYANEQFGGGTKLSVSGVTKVYYGGEDDRVWAHSDTSDGVSSVSTGTVTASGTSTITDASASFTAAMVGASVYIYEGDGKGSVAKITARNSATEIAISPSISTVINVSKYMVGGIPWSCRSGLFDLTDNWEMVVGFSPTTGDYRFDIRALFNHATTVDTNTLPNALGGNTKRDTTNGDLVVQMSSVQATAVTAGFGGGSAGYAVCVIPITVPSKELQGRRWGAYDLRGYQGDEAIRIEYVQMMGVQ